MINSIDFSTEEGAAYGSLVTQSFLGAVGFKALMAACGSALEVYATPRARLKALHPTLTPQMLDALEKGPDFRAWEKLLETSARLKIDLFAPPHAGYPATLRSLEAPPPLVFMRGTWLARDARAAALVGTRNPTVYGREAAFTLARDLCEKGFTVVSGLALGIDAAAHAGAVAAGGRTLAVIGCGLDIPYPRENLELRERIEENGAVISEHAPGVQPQQMNFPRRNRLISALSRAVVVVEAGAKSGALLTAAHARAQGRLLFAVPGPIFSTASIGTNALLREGAGLMTSAVDLVEALKSGTPGVVSSVLAPRRTRRPAVLQPQSESNLQLKISPKASSKSPSKSAQRVLPSVLIPASIVAPIPEPVAAEQDPVLRLWSGDEVCGVDALAARASAENLWPSRDPGPALLEALLMLEMRGRVERLPGPAYRRKRS